MGYGNATPEPSPHGELYEILTEDFKLPAYVAPLRQRIRNLPEHARNLVVAAWQGTGLPPLAAPDGSDSDALTIQQYVAWERLVAAHEAPAAPEQVEALVARFWEMTPGCSLEAMRRIALQGLDGGDDHHGIDWRNAAVMTDGRCQMVAKILDEIDGQQRDEVNRYLAPVADPPGQIIADPVVDADDLAQAIDFAKAKAAEVVAWVGTSPARATKALAAEYERKTPRKGVVEKLAPIAPAAAVPPAPQEQGEVGPGSVPVPTSLESSGEVGSGSAPADAGGASEGSSDPTSVPASPVPLATSDEAAGAEGPPPPSAPAEAPLALVPTDTDEGGGSDAALTLDTENTVSPEGVAPSTPTPTPSTADDLVTLARFVPILGRITAELAALVRNLEATLAERNEEAA